MSFLAKFRESYCRNFKDIVITVPNAFQDVTMATFARAGRLKTRILNRFPLLAEDIIFTGSQR